MLMVGRQEGHPACKKLTGEVLVWLQGWKKSDFFVQASNTWVW